MKYSQLQNKFFMKVPIGGNTINYFECYIYGYIFKKINTNFSVLLNNLEIKKSKLIKILKGLKEKELISENNKIIYTNKENLNKFLHYNNILAYDITFLPNLFYIGILDNALYWKLYKYSDPIRGMEECYTLGTKNNLQKIKYDYLEKTLGMSSHALKQSIKKLKTLKLIKVKSEGDGFYFGIQPIKPEMKEFWRNNDFLYNSKFLGQKDILEIYSDYANFYLK